MNSELQKPEKVIRIFLVSSLLTFGLSDFESQRARSEVVWKPIDIPKAQPTPLIWQTPVSDSAEHGQAPTKWEVDPETEDQNQPSSRVVWEVLENEDEALVPSTVDESNSRFIPPVNSDEVEALFDTIPLQSSDFKPLLSLSHAVPTASVLSQEEWRLIASTISPFIYASGTGNQNYAIQLDYGLNDTFQISGFYSEADDPLNARITGRDVRPGNLWKVLGGCALEVFYQHEFITSIKWFTRKLDCWKWWQ